MKRIHTLLHNPLEFRKEVLEAALDAAEGMKSLSLMQQYDTDGLTLRKQLKITTQNLQLSFKKLQQTLPDVPSEFQKAQTQKAQVTSPQIVSPYQQKLYQDIDDIRKKLKELSN